MSDYDYTNSDGVIPAAAQDVYEFRDARNVEPGQYVRFDPEYRDWRLVVGVGDFGTRTEIVTMPYAEGELLDNKTIVEVKLGDAA